MNNDEPTQPYQSPFPLPPHYAPLTPPPPPRQTFTPWGWYRRQSKRAQGGIGCFTVVVACLLCFTCASASAHTSSGNSLAAEQASPAVKVQYTKTNPTSPTPTPSPTPKPSPTPTPKPPTPTPVPTQLPPPPTPTLVPAQASGVNGNPWGYNFTPGNVIYSPPGAFCTYFSCISSFWNGHGYVEECQDGMYSKSGGIRGSCSHHGGDLQSLYSH
ncbi:hypothetical protein [Ktedonobacter sp. SOSP1-85]|uniref:hypothetical protein n=1 Tax=Ktedonobacter sp. SOSP1-85 TaxID=2778367 RepID=UPI00191616A9|nr:hypothetical protein [Ktedonobacter sp. SOSP1-85]